MAVRRRTNQEMSEETRAHLIRAAIECVHEHGYARTTTDLIAARAELTRGALQYHFKNKTQLMLAVAEAMYLGQIELFGAVLSEDAPFEKRFATMLDTAIQLYDTPEHLVFLELWMAARTDPELREVLGPLIQRTEDAIDAGFALTFHDAPAGSDDLLDARYLIQAALRGLALTGILHKQQSFLARKLRLLRRVMTAVVAQPAPR